MADYRWWLWHDLGVAREHAQRNAFNLKKRRCLDLNEFSYENMAYYQFYCEHIAEIPPYRRRNQDETGVDLRNVGPNKIRLPAGVSAFPAHDVLYDAPVRGGPHFTVFGLTSVRHLAPPIVWSNPIPGTCGAWDHMQ